ncbi:hypothetical protein FJ251_08390 [bacterium]|nr:hypothetical protein [bacterium]
MATTPLPPYRYAGARALVLLHEEQMRDFLAVWRQAAAAKLALPATADPDYASLETLLHHVLRAARGYLVWCCANLGLPAPGIPEAPAAERVAAEAESYLEALLAGWRTPLAGIDEDRFGEEYPSRWRTVYCIDAMLEHAVVHPMRHAFQLRRLLAAR